MGPVGRNGVPRLEIGITDTFFRILTILDNLVCEGFVREEPGVGKSSICLHITDKGIEVLIHMHEIVKMSAILSKKDDGEGNLPDSE